MTEDVHVTAGLVARASRMCSRAACKRLTRILPAIAVLLLTGCVGLWQTPSPPPLPSVPSLDFQKLTAPNVEPSLSGDPIAYRVGARWRYRDATADHRPTYRPGPDLSMEILGTVAAADGAELYVLHQEEPDGTERLYYLHRDGRGVVEYARSENGALMIPGAPARVIDLPFVAEKKWSYRIAGENYEVDCFFPETLWLGSGIHFDCWKIGVRNVTTGEAEYYWFKNGSGLLKIVRHSLSYELIDASTTEASAIHRFGWEDRDGTAAIDVGDRVVVQLPAEEASGYEWILSVSDPALVFPRSSGQFLADLGPENVGTAATSGTYVVQLDALSPTPLGAPMRLELAYAPAWDQTESVYAFTLWLVISP